MKIAYVCYFDKGTFASAVDNEETVLFNFLQGKGLAVEKVIWNDPTVIWEQYGLAILKSPWDYFEFIDDFYRWLDKIKTIHLPLLNPVDIVKWNADKHYLAEIEAAGLPVIPTVYLEGDATPSLDAYFTHFNTDKLIIKPCVSGGSFHTFKVTKNNQQEIATQLAPLLQEMEFMVQPFLREIETDGEWSLLFFNGKFSHALVKKAKSGDFRVQHYLGGTIHPETPSGELLATAEKYVQRFAQGCLYTRVDGVIVNGAFQLMELELIEPFLFLFTNENGLENYYQGLMEMVSLS